MDTLPPTSPPSRFSFDTKSKAPPSITQNSNQVQELCAIPESTDKQPLLASRRQLEPNPQITLNKDSEDPEKIAHGTSSGTSEGEIAPVTALLRPRRRVSHNPPKRFSFLWQDLPESALAVPVAYSGLGDVGAGHKKPDEGPATQTGSVSDSDDGIISSTRALRWFQKKEKRNQNPLLVPQEKSNNVNLESGYDFNGRDADYIMNSIQSIINERKRRCEADSEAALSPPDCKRGCVMSQSQDEKSDMDISIDEEEDRYECSQKDENPQATSSSDEPNNINMSPSTELASTLRVTPASDRYVEKCNANWNNRHSNNDSGYDDSYNAQDSPHNKSSYFPTWTPRGRYSAYGRNDRGYHDVYDSQMDDTPRRPKRGRRGGLVERGRGFSDRGRGFAESGRGISEHGRGFADYGRFFSQHDKGFSERGRCLSDRGRGFPEHDQEFWRRKPGRGFSEHGRGSSDRGRFFPQHDRGFSERGRRLSDRGRGFSGRDRVFPGRDQEFLKRGRLPRPQTRANNFEPGYGYGRNSFSR